MIKRTIINAAIAEQLTDAELGELVYSKALNLYFGEFGETFTDSEDSRLLAAVLAIFVLDAEIRNGGLDQFFRNSADFAENALYGLELLGVMNHHLILAKAITINEEQANDYLNERNPSFSPLDDEYYSLDNFYIELQRFIRKNVKSFLD